MEPVFIASVVNPRQYTETKITIYCTDTSEYLLKSQYYTTTTNSIPAVKQAYYTAVESIEDDIIQTGGNPDELELTVTRNDIFEF
jgi:hypothetical protein